MFGLSTPDITLGQTTAAATWIVSQLIAMGVIDKDQSQLLLQVCSTVLAFAWFIGDAVMRNGRAKAAATVAAINSGTTPTTEVPVS